MAEPDTDLQPGEARYECPICHASITLALDAPLPPEIASMIPRCREHQIDMIRTPRPS